MSFVDVHEKIDGRGKLMNQQNKSLQDKIIQEGQSIFNGLEEGESSIFNKNWWYGRIMEWCMNKPAFKVQMFRFVDVLPYLHNNAELAGHLKEYFSDGEHELPSVFNFGVGIGSLAPGLLALAVKKNIVEMAKMFITGATPEEALVVLEQVRHKSQMAFTVDLLGEATLSEKEAQDYQTRYFELMKVFTQAAKTWQPIALLDQDDCGDVPIVNISVKLTSIFSKINEAAWEWSKEKVKDRLRPLFREAMKNFVFINIDMEQFAHKDLSISIFSELIMEDEFKAYAHFGIVIQAYLRDSLADCDGLIQVAKKRKKHFTIRLVKGAYWDYETIHANQQGWPNPVYTNKAESDVNFEACADHLLKAYPLVRIALGSHNVRSIAAALVMAKEYGVPKRALEIQMLYGMADPIKSELVRQGYRVRQYATIGDLIPGMAYLVRRLLENTSNESFLKSKFADDVDALTLLADPNRSVQASSAMGPKLASRFYNEALLDLNQARYRNEVLLAIKKIPKDLGKTYPIIINNKKVKTGRLLDRFNPSHPAQLVGRLHLGSSAEADQALISCQLALPSWRNCSIETRCSYLDKLANEILNQRYSLMALEMHESGKTWQEADGDVTEAIDFCRYYAREMRRLGKPMRVGHAKGEVSLRSYRARGVGVIIAPWNFPLAILTGLVSAAIVTGNTVIMKPAEQSSVIAARLMEMVQKVGIPPGVVNFLPGLGEEVGEYLVNNKDIQFVSFTGSKEVGLKIIARSGQVLPNQKQVKKAVVEMGGKNTLIIDSDADLDEAVAGVVYSAFGFQGQKCSACSRVMVLAGNYDRFVTRLVEATKSLIIGNPQEPEIDMGPLVDEAAKNKVMAFIVEAKTQFTTLLAMDAPVDGYFVGPHIFSDVDPSHPLSQQEIFGPVLAVLKVETIDEAIRITNQVEYALTGGLYSRSPSNIAKVKSELEVGNLYINRSITGAMVDRHPFGGYKMSGMGSKTGDKDYLLQFMDPICVTENTMRRGFAPEED